jgi:hypothetical protein
MYLYNSISELKKEGIFQEYSLSGATTFEEILQLKIARYNNVSKALNIEEMMLQDHRFFDF